MLIDFHTHCFPNTIAERAIEKLSVGGGGLRPEYDGTAEGLQNCMRENGVDMAVVLNIATNARQQQKVNDFACEINKGNIIAFGSVFPDAPDALDEIDRIAAMGLKGIKLHPEYQGFYVDDAKMKPIYKRMAKHGLILTLHAGRDDGYAPPVHCPPERLAAALAWMDMPVVAAHWGGRGMEEDVIRCLCGENIFFDTAYGYGSVNYPLLLRLVEKHGTGKILFGTDAPWHAAWQELRVLKALGLSAAEEDEITHKNAQRLLFDNA